MLQDKMSASVTGCRRGAWTLGGITVAVLILGACRPVIDSKPEAFGTRDEPLHYKITAKNNPTSFGVSGQPPGIAVDAATGDVTGTPTQEGTFSATMTATNDRGTDSQPLAFRIDRGPHPVVSRKELLIIAPQVVQSQRAQAGGPWHIRSVLQRIAPPGADLEAFAQAWFDSWSTTSETFNGDSAAARPGVASALKDAWQKDRFRLIAIVNRIDLTKFQDGDPQQPTQLGEGRFIFELENGNALPCTIIFEYRLPSAGDLKQELERWATLWHGLGRGALGGPEEFPDAYLAALQQLTDAYSANGQLNQVRTNERLGGAPIWQLREFKLDGASGRLRHGTVAQTPIRGKDGQDELKNLIISLQGDLLAGTHQVPSGALGVFSETPEPPAPVWNVPTTPPAADPRARFIFSFNTCSGCHGADTGARFQHVFGSKKGEAAQLSDFLKGQIRVAQPLPPAANSWLFHDEMADRGTLLAVLAKDVKPEPSMEQKLKEILARRSKRVH